MNGVIHLLHRVFADGRKEPVVGHEALRKRVRRAEADSGARPDLPSTQEREEIRRLRTENYQLRRANEILKSASVFFAKEESAGRPAWSRRWKFSTSKT